MNNKKVNYDICYIVDDQKLELTTAIKKEFIEILTRDDGVILKDEEFKKEFAYEIKKRKSGHYFVLIVKTNPKNIQEFNRVFAIKEKQDEVIRSLIINLDSEKINKFKERKVLETNNNFKESKEPREQKYKRVNKTQVTSENKFANKNYKKAIDNQETKSEKSTSQQQEVKI